MPATSIGQQKGLKPLWKRLTAGHTTSVSKLNELVFEVLPHLPYLRDLSPTNYHFFKHLNNFFQGKHFHNQQDAKKKKKKKMFSKVHWILKHGFFCYRNKQTFLICKNVLTLMIPILINKNVFEPNYNDLKLMVQNHNHKPNIFYSLYIARNSSICKFW